MNSWTKHNTTKEFYLKEVKSAIKYIEPFLVVKDDEILKYYNDGKSVLTAFHALVYPRN